ncbi:MAG: hypothetical protein ACOYJU_05900 [Anaerovoracaceae bacterium]|jgi:hypothetical protein
MSHEKNRGSRVAEQLRTIGRESSVFPRETAITRAVDNSIEVFYASQMSGKLSYGEFFRIQVGLIEKRWWLFQGILLLGVWGILSLSSASQETQRAMSIAAALFVVLAVPEIWRNKTSKSMEIEGTTYYTLRQVYSAKLIAFGLVDVLMLSGFCLITTSTQAISLFALLTQLVFPVLVATSICFFILCGKKHLDEVIAIVACVGVNSLWMLIVMREEVYEMITPGLWGLMLFLAGGFTVMSLWRVLKNSNRYEEVMLDGTHLG